VGARPGAIRAPALARANPRPAGADPGRAVPRAATAAALGPVGEIRLLVLRALRDGSVLRPPEALEAAPAVVPPREALGDPVVERPAAMAIRTTSRAAMAVGAAGAVAATEAEVEVGAATTSGFRAAAVVAGAAAASGPPERSSARVT
jgi:hypothetical protein